MRSCTQPPRGRRRGREGTFPVNRLERWLEKGQHVKEHHSGLDILKYIGPGLLVTVGFIDPGNWASNMAAGSTYGYGLLWMVTLSTIMLIVLQHNAAHLGIVSGLCLAEAATAYTPRWVSRVTLTTALVAVAATVMAEVLGGAIALNMLFHLPVKLGAVLVTAVSLALILTNSYRKIERWIIGFVSLIGISFLIEVAMVHVDWPAAAVSWVSPSVPGGAMPIVMSVLGAVVMPHNLFLHSEIIQSRKWHLEDEQVIQRQLKYEFTDTLLSMIIGWAINSAMIILAAATFFTHGIVVDDLAQAAETLTPIAGPAASLIFAIALLLAGVSSSVTAGMAGGTISAGIVGEGFDIKDRHSRFGIIACFIVALVVVFVLQDSFAGLVWSQTFLSMQLPITIFLQVYLTSSKRVMGKFANGRGLKVLLLVIALVVTGLNVALVVSSFTGA